MSAAAVHRARPELVNLLVPVADLHPHPRNARVGDVDAIARSLTVFGQMKPILANKAGTIVAGNHTYRAALKLGWTHIAANRVAMTEDEELAYLLADNRHSDLATYDEEQLKANLAELEERGLLDGTGYDEAYLDQLERDLDALADDEEPGSKLALVDVSIEEPKIGAVDGDVWQLGQHYLCVVSVYTGWTTYSHFLVDDSLLVPYPTPTLPLTKRARANRLVLVQPDPYLASHLIDKWVSVNGDSEVRKVV